MKIIRIKDYYGHYQEVPVSDELFAEWIKMNNEHQRDYKRESYHRSGIPLDAADELHAYEATECLADDLIREEQNKRLYAAISSLTSIQKRRVLMFMDNMNYTDIARFEDAKFPSVYRSLQAAFKKIRTLMKDYEES